VDQRRQTILVLALIGVFAVTVGVAYWFGEGSASTTTTTASAPVKKFRAKPGTERKGARALLSSVPSLPEETTNRPIEVWGSLEPEKTRDEADRARAEIAADLEPSVSSQQGLREDIKLALAMGDHDNAAYLQAALAAQLVDSNPPQPELADEAFQEALSHASGPESAVFVVAVYAQALHESESHQRVTEVTELSAFEAYPFSSRLLQVALLRGMAFEQLESPEEALSAYEQAFDAARRTEADRLARASDVLRIVSLRLARLHRELGNSAEATAVARRLRVLLEL